MDDFQKYVEDNKEHKESTEVNLTKDQKEAVQNLSGKIGISFEDTVMLLVELQLSDIGSSYLTQFIQPQAMRN